MKKRDIDLEKKQLGQFEENSYEPRNIMVIGDLLIDHTVFVFSSEEHPPPIPGEGSFRVVRRLDSAGGAATTARAINVIPETTVYLWGLVGSSPWGTFREILERSQDIDGAHRRIHLRGIQDETDSSMTTISRLVSVRRGSEGREYYKRHARFSDFGHIHIPIDRQVGELHYTLNHIKSKGPLDCVILNDLEFGALHSQVVSCVSGFCEAREIPLIVRIRRDYTKYAGISCRALICTLAEWCNMVGEKRSTDFWSQNIGKKEVAEDFIRNTMHSFGGAEAYVVLIGEDWIDSVLLIEKNAESGKFKLSHFSGISSVEKGKSQQVGVSDVFVGALCAALPRNQPENNADNSLVSAVYNAMNVVSVYQLSRWNHIHRLRENTNVYSGPNRSISEVSGAAKHLPADLSISLSSAKTQMPHVYSVSSATQKVLAKMASDTSDDDKSMVLVATGGSGKSLIASSLIKIAKEAGWNSYLLENTDISWDLNDPELLIDSICKHCRSDGEERIFLVVDEFLKLKGGDKVASNGVVLLNKAAEKKIRFLFIDADFLKINLDDLRSQFARRVEWHTLPSAFERPEDVPYVIASFLLATYGQENRIFVETAFLISVMEWIMDGNKTFGHLLEILRKISRSRDLAEEIVFRWQDLPANLRGKIKPVLTGCPELMQVTN